MTHFDSPTDIARELVLMAHGKPPYTLALLPSYARALLVCANDLSDFALRPERTRLEFFAAAALATVDKDDAPENAARWAVRVAQALELACDQVQAERRVGKAISS